MHLLTILAQLLQISGCPDLEFVQHNSMVASDVQLQTLDEDKHRGSNQFLAVKSSSLLCGSDQKRSYLDLQDYYLWGDMLDLIFSDVFKTFCANKIIFQITPLS